MTEDTNEEQEKFRMLHDLNKAIERPIPKDENGSDPEVDEEKRREREMKKRHLFELLEDLFGKVETNDG